MANSAAATKEVPQENTAGPTSGVSILDPDVLVFALPLAGTLDVLSYVFVGADAGIVAAVINIILGGFLVLWMVWRGKRIDQAKQQYQQKVQTARQGRAGMRQRRLAARQMNATNIVGKRASRRILKRSLIMYIGNSIPIVNFIPFWLVGIVMMLRGE